MTVVISEVYLSSKICSFRVAGGDGGVVPQQQIVHRGANNLTATDHYRSLPCHRYTCREAVMSLRSFLLTCILYVFTFVGY